LNAVTLGIGWLLVAFSQNKRRMHDFVAGTLVVQRDPTPQARAVVVGVLCALAALPVIGIIAAIAVPGLLRARVSGNEASALDEGAIVGGILLPALNSSCSCGTTAPTCFRDTSVAKARQASNEAIARQDVEGISSFWLDDYVVIRGSGVIERGKEANETNWKRVFREAPQTYFERIPSEIIVSKNDSDLAWETGEWKGLNTYSKGGRYSAQWKKKDGQWKLQAELFVASRSVQEADHRCRGDGRHTRLGQMMQVLRTGAG
jgi:ketosteroid isomerase-like protein